MIIAVVIFEVIHAPVRERLRIDFLMTQATRIARTGKLQDIRCAGPLTREPQFRRLTSPALEYIPNFSRIPCSWSAKAAIPLGNLVIFGMIEPFEPRCVAQQSSRIM